MFPKLVFFKERLVLIFLITFLLCMSKLHRTFLKLQEVIFAIFKVISGFFYDEGLVLDFLVILMSFGGIFKISHSNFQTSQISGFLVLSFGLLNYSNSPSQYKYKEET